MSLYIFLAAAILAIAYGGYLAARILKFPAGEGKMIGIARAIQEGASAYLARQYKTIGAIGVVIFFVLGFALNWRTATGFAVGAVL